MDLHGKPYSLALLLVLSIWHQSGGLNQWHAKGAANDSPKDNRAAAVR
jgi:hypothetical protein